MAIIGAVSVGRAEGLMAACIMRLKAAGIYLLTVTIMFIAMSLAIVVAEK